VQLASKTDGAEDQEDVGRDPLPSTMPPASDFQHPYVEPVQAGHPYGQRYYKSPHGLHNREEVGETSKMSSSGIARSIAGGIAMGAEFRELHPKLQ
jgi:hypothetical protein